MASTSSRRRAGQTRARSRTSRTSFGTAVRELVEIVADVPAPTSSRSERLRESRRQAANTISLAGQRAATDSDRAVQVSRRLRTSAARLDAVAASTRRGRFSERAPAIDRSGARCRRTADRGGRCSARGRRSEAAGRRALRSFVRARAGDHGRSLGPNHPTMAVVRSRLGQPYQKTG